MLERLNTNTSNKIISHIHKFRNEGDRVILSIHWGSNWGYDIPKSQKQFAHQLIDSGTVDLVHGHSSHHPKAIEVYNNHLILYGTGDLINDYEGIAGREEYRDEISLMYFPKLTSSGKLVSLTIAPMKIHRFRLNKVTDKDQQWITERLNRECKKFGTSIERSDNGFLNLRW